MSKEGKDDDSVHLFSLDDGELRSSVEGSQERGS